MSNARSPRAVRSMTIGTRGMGQRLAGEHRGGRPAGADVRLSVVRAAVRIGADHEAAPGPAWRAHGTARALVPPTAVPNTAAAASSVQVTVSGDRADYPVHVVSEASRAIDCPGRCASKGLLGALPTLDVNGDIDSAFPAAGAPYACPHHRLS